MTDDTIAEEILRKKQEQKVRLEIEIASMAARLDAKTSKLGDLIDAIEVKAGQVAELRAQLKAGSTARTDGTD